MGIQVEFNPDLALRNIREHKNGRSLEECIPPDLSVDEDYPFLKQGQRCYWLHGEIPLLETQGEAKLSRPIASIIILEATHFLKEGQMYTKGIYRVVKVFDSDDARVYFEGMNKNRNY